MVLTLDQRVEIIMLCGREGWSHQAVANEFSRRHPDVNPPLHSTSVGRLLQKFKETGSVLDKKREATNGISENEEVLAYYVMQNPHASLQKQAGEADLSNDSLESFEKAQIQSLQIDDFASLARWG